MRTDLPLHRTIRPPSGWAGLDGRELWEYRDLLVTLAVRDVRLRYRQTVLGVLWVILQPLIAAGIFTFVFNRIARLPGGGGSVPYFAWAFAGQIAWAAFSGTLTRSGGSLLQNAPLVAKVFFPRLVLPLSTLGGAIIDFGVGIVVLLLIIVGQHAPLGWQIVTLPLWFALTLLLGLGAGLIASSLMVGVPGCAVYPAGHGQFSAVRKSGWLGTDRPDPPLPARSAGHLFAAQSARLAVGRVSLVGVWRAGRDRFMGLGDLRGLRLGCLLWGRNDGVSAPGAQVRRCPLTPATVRLWCAAWGNPTRLPAQTVFGTTRSAKPCYGG